MGAKETSSGGPYLNAALICETLLTSHDGVLSYIRVIDNVNVGAIGSDPPADMPLQQVPFTLCLALKSGDARGRHMIKVRPEAPSGVQLPTVEVHLNLEGNERGVNVNLNLNGIPFDQEGVWWFDVLFGDNDLLLTRVPLKFTYQPQRVLTAG